MKINGFEDFFFFFSYWKSSSLSSKMCQILPPKILLYSKQKEMVEIISMLTLQKFVVNIHLQPTAGWGLFSPSTVYKHDCNAYTQDCL